MSTPAVPQPDIEEVQHPTLGTLKFPKDMPYDQRNQIISRMESEATMSQPSDSVAGGVLQRLKDMVPDQPKTPLDYLVRSMPGLEAGLGLVQANKKLGPQLVQQVKEAAQERGSRSPLGQANPIPTLSEARALTTGLSMLDPFASGSVANVNELQDQGRSREALGQGGTDAALLATGTAAPRVLPPMARGVGSLATKAAGSVDPDILGLGSPRLAHLQSIAARAGAVATKLGTPADTSLPASLGSAQAPDVAAAPAAVQDTAPLGTVPKTASGEAVLNNALTSLDNKNLLKIARSRGIDVTAEAQLKPGVANGRLVSKIMNDFSTDELLDARDKGLEMSRNIPVATTTTPEAWQYKVLQTFFPEVSIPKAMQARAQAAIAQRPTAATGDNIVDLLKQSIEMAQKGK